jgi:hypothetical protein
MKQKKISVAALSFCILVISFPSVAFAQWNLNDLSQFGLPGSPILQIVIKVMEWLLVVVGIAGIIGFAIAGILYLTSAGDDDRMEQAKNAMVYSIIGVVVALSGFVALQAAFNMLSAKNDF